MRTFAPDHARWNRAALGRRVLAAWAVLVWILGVEVGPGLHIALHERLAHHHHEGSERHEHHADEDHGGHHGGHHHGSQAEDPPRLDAHRHDVHERDAPHQHGAPAITEPPARFDATHVDGVPTTDTFERPSSHPPVDLDHGANSLAHRQVVLLRPPPVLPPILSAPWRPLVVLAIHRVPTRSRAPRTTRARGPPSGPSVAPIACGH